MYVLGILTGISLSIVVSICTLHNRSKVERFMRQAESKLSAKGSIIEPDDETINNWVESLPKE